MAELLKTDGTSQEVHPKNEIFGLKEMYDLLNCNMVQVIFLDDGRIMWLDEEGKFKDQPVPNPRATELLHLAGGWVADYVVGDVLITAEREVQ